MAITDVDVAAGSMNSEDRVIMTEWQGASDCDDAGLPIWTFMDASRVTSDSEIFERDALGMAPAAAPASTERCYGDGVGGQSYRLACTPTGALRVSTWFCSNCSAAVGPASETKEGEHPTVNKTAEGWEICEAGATPRIVSSCGGLAVAQSFSGAVATASGPFGSFRRYRTPMEALREDHPLWVGSSLGKNATAARRDNDMLAGLGYETTSALPHLCVDSRERESLGWTTHVTANGGYLSIETDQPQSWCLGSDYVSLECPNSGGVHVWCVNATQLEGAARLPDGHCRNELDGADPNDSGCSGLSFGTHGYVWNGIDLGGAWRGSLYKQGYFARLIPKPCDASIPIDNGNPGVAAIAGDTSYTYDFIVNADYYHHDHGLFIYYVKLDGVLPSADQFTVHVDSYRESCVSLPGGSCVAGVAGFIDGDEFTLTNWHKASTTAGTHVFSITTTAMVSQIEIKYFRPMYKPGWLIKMNGVEVYRESANGGSDDLPSPVTHTYNLIPIDNGNPGNCTASLAHGASCTPTCDTGYVLSASRSCDNGVLRDTARCNTGYTLSGV